MTANSSSLPRIDDLDVRDRRVLVRCDLNVPFSDGVISDDLRIEASVPTLKKLREHGARLAVCSHLGRPKGRVVDDLRMRPVGTRLQELLGEDVLVVSDVVGETARAACGSGTPVVLLENLRFEAGEEGNDPEFADDLAALADAYVNDAFGASHRAHASIVGVAQRLPSASGLLLAEEVEKLERLLESPEHPFVAVLGGVKVSDKLGVLGNLLDRVDSLVIGGAMAFTLLAAQGHDVGDSLVEQERIEEVRSVLDDARERNVRVLLPVDVVASDSTDGTGEHEIVPLSKIGDRMGVDIGPDTAATFADEITHARTILWNGPMGIFEVDDFAEGTRSIARAIAEATESGAYTVAGGGDSAAALKQLGMTAAVSHLSTGGGASLEFLEGKELPGIAILKKGMTG